MDLNSVYMVTEDKAIDIDFVLDFLEFHYFTRESLLSKYFKLHELIITTAIRKAILADLRRRYEVIVKNCAMILVGVHVESGHQCGIGLAMLERRQDQGKVPEWDRVPFTAELLAVWCRHVEMVVERQKDFFKLFPDVERIMRIVMIGVEQEHERKRVGTNMLREIVDRASKYGAELVWGAFTSDHLKRVAHRFGFRSFCDLNLSDFHDPKGDMIYEGVENQVVSLMAIRV